jgi:DNA-binding XRE family transcriptional regulator
MMSVRYEIEYRKEVNNMFPNLDAEMARMGVTKKDLSQLLGVRYATLIDKTNGKSRFTLDEALEIRNSLFPGCTVEYLFRKYPSHISA